jgi:ketosteroid isomerase-like protein
MKLSLPESIASYFAAKGGSDTEAVLACFTPTATVVDEGENKTMNGHQAIREWLDGPIAGYKLTTEVTGGSEQDGDYVVTAIVSGDFPGSPIDFSYHFHLEGDKIAKLAIK